MRDFIISTDNNCDLPADYIMQNQIDIQSLFYQFDNGELYNHFNQLEPQLFYSRMRNGEMPSTMATNPEDSKLSFKKIIDKNIDIIHISFSSALSSTYQNTVIAANEITEEYPECKITVVDSLCASMGQGLLVYKAVEFMKQGHSYQEVVDYIESTKGRISHQFTVDDLFHLHRGGRVSKTAAVVGTLINVKPLLHVNDIGQLIPVDKTRGRKKSLIALADNMFKTMGDNDNSVIMISHGDCLEDANFLASIIKEKFPDIKIIINYVCATIGAHSGPGTMALFFEANQR